MPRTLRDVIEQAVRTALAPTDIQAVDVEQAHDHADEDALFITVKLPPATPLIGGKKYLDVITDVNDALLHMGERRFPYVHISHGGEEAAEEASRDQASAS